MSPSATFQNQVVIALAAHPLDTDEQIADRILRTAATRGDLQALLRPLAVNEVQHRRRLACLIVERAVVVKQSVPLTGTPSRIAALLLEGFALPGQGWVIWGEATVEQHMARADWLHLHALGTLASEARHRWAATFLSEQGLECLNDAPETVLHQALPITAAKASDRAAMPSEAPSPKLVPKSRSLAVTAP